ncbi:hypothetical protein [uncultured Prevotella sp.]|uniref:hypothetical protein n=1 Tax=uncultured Prevotella sp. TaxID=159272 RepID=UPI0026761AEA|nr:hypothetical protein [uncultured Prevotella sp.]
MKNVFFYFYCRADDYLVQKVWINLACASLQNGINQYPSLHGEDKIFIRKQPAYTPAVNGQA